MAHFYGWGSTASRPEPPRGGRLLFTLYTYANINIYIFHKIRAIPLVLAQLSGNCSLIIEPFENSEKLEISNLH